MNIENKRFAYFEGYRGLFVIVIIGLFFWNFTDEGKAFMESFTSTNLLVLFFFILYVLVTLMGGLFLIFVILNDVIDSLFESRNINNLKYKNQKTVILTICIAAIGIWFFAHYEPRQECIKNITLSGSVYKYENKDFNENFKSRNDAIDYCMAHKSIL